MTRRVLYVAHPLAPTDDEIYFERMTLPTAEVPNSAEVCVRRNIDLALRWLAWLRRSFPQDTFIAPWIAAVLSGEDDGDPKQREAGLVDDCAVVERCDGIVMTGSRIGSGGDRERRHGMSYARGWTCAAGFEVYDLTWLACREPPAELEMLHGMTLDEYVTWMIGYRADDRRQK